MGKQTNAYKQRWEAEHYKQVNPRLLDNLMTEALLLGAQLEKSVVDTETVRLSPPPSIPLTS